MPLVEKYDHDLGFAGEQGRVWPSKETTSSNSKEGAVNCEARGAIRWRFPEAIPRANELNAQAPKHGPTVVQCQGKYVCLCILAEI